MAGVPSLLGQQQMPGQAQQQPMPGMMPQQGAPTPGAMVDQLATMPFEKLEQFYSNPRPQSPPLYAVIAAIVKQQKAAQMAQARQGQQVMAQNAQMQQQPPIAEGIMQQARQQHMPQIPQQPVMAAYGGEMHGYAGGGAVAFQSAGAVPPGLLNPDFDEDGLPRSKDERQQIIDYNERLKSAYQQKMQAQSRQEQAAQATAPRPFYPEEAKQRLEQFYRFGPRGSGGLDSAASVSPTSAPIRMQDTRGGTPEMAALAQMLSTSAASAEPASPATGTSQRRQPTAQKPPAAGIAAALQEQPPTPAIDARAAAAAAAAEQQAMQRAGQVTPEEIAARQGIDKLLGASASSFKDERKRREAVAQQRMQEAQARFDRPGYQDMVGIGRLLQGMAGAKTLYGGLTGAGAAAGKYQEDKEAALRAAQEKFDLSGKEMFELNRLQQQVQMDQAKLAEARASGDAQRSVKAALDVANSQKELAQYQTELRMKREKMELDTRDVETRRISAEAARTQAGKPSEIQQREALYRRDPSAYEAMFGPKESAAVANLVRAVNSDPLLKNLAEMAKLDPNAVGRYNARYKELVATHAPQLLLGAGGGGGGGSLEAATAIARGGK